MHASIRLISAAVFVATVSTAGLCPSAAKAVTSLPLALANTAPLPILVNSYDSHLRYDGRFYTKDPAGPKCGWPATGVTIRFRAAAANITISDSSASTHWEVVVDGVPTEILAPPTGAHTYSLYRGDAGSAHKVDIVKRTEMNLGVGQVLGFQLASGGKLLQTPPFKHRIEIIGDSISAGYGSEGTNENILGTPLDENSYITYGAEAARAFNGGLTCLGWSGIKMWPSWGMPDVYDVIASSGSDEKWDYTKDVPNAVLINLGTNDWWNGPPDETAWTAAYEKFIGRVRANYPNALIYCATSPMMNGAQLAEESAYLGRIVAFENSAGDGNVKFLRLPVQDPKTGIGADWHPNGVTHRLMANAFIDALKKDLGWKTVKTNP